MMLTNLLNFILGSPNKISLIFGMFSGVTTTCVLPERGVLFVLVWLRRNLVDQYLNVLNILGQICRKTYRDTALPQRRFSP